jgi:polyisoprenoid-binding protein YceI
MKMEKTSGQATFGFGEDGQLSIEGLKITLKAEDLKSEHNGMDKNAYKAMKTDKFPNIVFEMTRLENVSKNGEGYKVSCSGKLTVSGTTKTVSLPASVKINPDGSLTCSGSKAMKMTDLGIDPPTAVFGTIKTGDDITIVYKATFNKSN